MSEAESPTESVLCSKCGHLNARSESTCVSCGSHLRLKCRHCGRRNLRTDSRCAECGRSLHRSPLTRFKRFFSRGKRKLILLQAILLVLGVLISWKVIVFLAEFRVPEASE